MFDPHKFVYHYTRAETLINNILPSMVLQMGSYQRLNDPREAKSWPFKFYSRSPGGNALFTAALFAEATKNITQKTLVLCCSRDDPSVDKNSEDLPIRSGYGHPRMWAQYADQHKGVCLVLDQELLHQRILAHFGDDNLFSGPVEYLNSMMGPSSSSPAGCYDLIYLEDFVKRGVTEALEDHIRLFQKDLFFTKHQDWRDEWEYRWVVRTENDTPYLVPIADCLHSIILGQDCPGNITEDIIGLCRARNMPVHRVIWHGWQLSLLPNFLDEEFHKGPIVILDGISFSTAIQCCGVFVQARDQYENVCPIRIDNNGNVVVLGEG
jgi:hypothetical protein